MIKGEAISEVVKVTAAFTIRSGLYQGRLPAIFLNDGTDELVLIAGPKLQDATIAKEFAWHVVGAAVGFAGLVTNRLSASRIGWPADSPERDAES